MKKNISIICQERLILSFLLWMGGLVLLKYFLFFLKFKPLVSTGDLGSHNHCRETELWEQLILYLIGIWQKNNVLLSELPLYGGTQMGWFRQSKLGWKNFFTSVRLGKAYKIFWDWILLSIRHEKLQKEIATISALYVCLYAFPHLTISSDECFQVIKLSNMLLDNNII